MSEIQHKIISFEFKATEGDGSVFKGYGNAFHNIDSAGEIVVPGAFTDSMAAFLSDGFIGGLNHNWDDPIGKPTKAYEDATGLYLEALIDINTPEASKCRELIKKQVIKKMSIGYRVKGSEYLETAEDVAKYWEGAGYTPSAQDISRAQYGARLLTKIDPLYEVSPVTVPANSLAAITGVKALENIETMTERDFERFLRDAKFSRSQATAITLHGFKALHQRDADEAAETTTAASQEAVDLYHQFLATEARLLGVGA